MGINISMMQPQNFSIPAGYNEVITFDVDPAVAPSLGGTTIWWRVYEQQFGIPNFGFDAIGSPSPTPVIEKLGSSIDSPLSFTVQMFTDDTINLLRNFYHEASIVDAASEVIGMSWGIMTVTATVNR